MVEGGSNNYSSYFLLDELKLFFQAISQVSVKTQGIRLIGLLK
jgi:hypothetical protein